MTQKKILIIDDEFPMRYLIEHQLKREGFTVTLAKDGPDGLTAVSQHRPDLVVLDVMMPGMDGFALARAQLGPLAVLDLAVDEHVTVGDPLLGFATRAVQASGFQELVELDEFPFDGKSDGHGVQLRLFTG